MFLRTLRIFIFFVLVSGLFILTQTHSIAQHNDNGIVSTNWSPNGLYIAVQTFDVITVYTRNMDEVGQIQVSPIGRENAVWSPDSTRLAFYHQEQRNYFEIRALQDLQTPIIRLEVLGSGDIDWNPNGTQVVLGTSLIETPENPESASDYISLVEGIPVVDTASGVIIHDLSEELLVSARIVAWSPDGRYIAGASGGDEIVFWDALTGEVAKALSVPPRASGLVWSPDGSLLAQTSTNGVILWDVDQEEIVRTLLPTVNLGSVGGVLDWQGDIIVSETRDSLGEQQILYFWQASTGNIIRSLDVAGEYVWSLALSPDGSQVVLGGFDGTITVISVIEENTCPAAPNPDHILNIIANPGQNIDRLRSAISQDTNGDGEVVIELERDSTYTFTSAAITSTTYGDAALPLINHPVTIYGRCSTFIRPLNTSTIFRFFRVESAGHLTLHDVTLMGGRVTGVATYPGHYANGGAIHVRLGDLTLNRTTFLDNQANYRGGAVYIIGTSQADRALLTITDSTFDNNRASEGGAISTQLTNTVIMGSRFTNNNVINPSTGIGSALHFLATNNASAINSCFEGNFTPATSVWASIYQLNTFNFSNNWWGSLGGPQIVPGGANQNALPVPDTLRQGIPYSPPSQSGC